MIKINKIKQKLEFVPLIILDDGHGDKTAGKRTPRFSDGSFIHENQFNKPVVDLIEGKLKKLGFETLQVAPELTDISLYTRSSRANSAYDRWVRKYNQQKVIDNLPIAIYISIHFNAITGVWQDRTKGVETYHYRNNFGDGQRLASCIHGEVIKGTVQVNRGVKGANFHVLRETMMPAVLLEAGFMDYETEARLMLDEKFWEEVASEVVQGVCNFYRVDNTLLDGMTTEQSEGDNLLTSIMGQTVATVEQMVYVALKGNQNPKLPHCSIETLATLFIEEGANEGVRGDGAFAQALKETGYFGYGGIVLPEQNNYAGIGALNRNKQGQAASFDSPRMGVRAQIQHLKAYGSTDALNNACVDPRFGLVKRGSAKYFEWLGYKDNPNGAGWAWPGAGYGKSLIAILENILQAPKKDGTVVLYDPLKLLVSKKIIKEQALINHLEKRLDETVTLRDVIALLAEVM